MSNKNVHTVHNKEDGRKRYENSEEQAAERERAIKNNSEHVIHGLNGRIQNKNSYGNDPFPPRDRK